MLKWHTRFYSKLEVAKVHCRSYNAGIPVRKAVAPMATRDVDNRVGRGDTDEPSAAAQEHQHRATLLACGQEAKEDANRSLEVQVGDVVALLGRSEHAEGEHEANDADKRQKEVAEDRVDDTVEGVLEVGVHEDADIRQLYGIEKVGAEEPVDDAAEEAVLEVVVYDDADEHQ